MRKGNQEKEKMLSDQWGQVSEGESQTYTQIHPRTILFSADHVRFNDTIVDLSFDEGNTEIFLIKGTNEVFLQSESPCSCSPNDRPISGMLSQYTASFVWQMKCESQKHKSNTLFWNFISNN